MDNELHLDEFVIVAKDLRDNEIIYTVEPESASKQCEKCGSFNTVFNGDAEPRYIRDLPSFEYEISVLLKQKRIRCRTCGAMSLQSFNSIDSRDKGQNNKKAP